VVGVPGGSAQDQTVGLVDLLLLPGLLEQKGVRLRAGWVIEGLDAGSVRIGDEEGRKEEILADTVVLATNRRPRSEVVEALWSSAGEVHVAGDCKEPRILYYAVHDGFEAALEL
jgi:hypothetical protein